jgi:hypothetical protein
MCSVAPVVRDLPGAVTAGEGEPDRHPIVALSATSTEDSIHPKYGNEGSSCHAASERPMTGVDAA